MTPLLLLACTGAPPPPPPTGVTDASTIDTADTGTTTDPSAGLPDGFTWGDPIETDAVTETEKFYEHLDAARIGDDRGMLVSNNGFVVVDLATGEPTLEFDEHNGFQVAWDPTIDVAWVGTKLSAVWKVDVSDPDNATILSRGNPWSGGHEDLDCEDGRVLVSAHEDGAVLMDDSFQVLSTFPASYAVGAGLHQGRAVITDANEVVLIDWSDPESPMELDRLALRVTGWDLDFDGTHVAVAQGAEGVAVLAVVDDTLVLRGELPSPGGAYGVSLDGDSLWATAWSQTMLIWLGGDAPVVVGHEPSADAAMALGALGDGRVLVADWQKISILSRTDFVAGAEVDLAEELWFPVGEPDSQTLTVLNGGAQDLVLDFQAPETFTVDPASLVLAPGAETRVSVRPVAEPVAGTLRWTSNDPDEPSGQVKLSLADTTIGQPHPDFSLEAVLADGSSRVVVTNDDLHGQIAYIAWFSPT